MQKDVILTPEGLEKLKQEIEHLSVTRRREVAERIKEAREFGDISENSEYDDAKNEQAMLESRIAQLEDKLRSAQVINASELDTNLVRVGSLVAGIARVEVVVDVPAHDDAHPGGVHVGIERGHVAAEGHDHAPLRRGARLRQGGDQRERRDHQDGQETASQSHGVLLCRWTGGPGLPRGDQGEDSRSGRR